MSRRPSIANGYPNRPGTRMLPPSYQPEPIPMFPVAHTNSFKNNRVAPPPPSHQCRLFYTVKDCFLFCLQSFGISIIDDIK
jgi:hypothetical protein